MNITGLAKYIFVIMCGTACFTTAASAADCAQRAATASKKEAALSPILGYKVSGNGRLYFHSAPDAACRSKATFVVPGDTLIAYSEYEGWLSVMYTNPRTADSAEGWVRSDRLKALGTMNPGK